MFILPSKNYNTEFRVVELDRSSILSNAHRKTEYSFLYSNERSLYVKLEQFDCLALFVVAIGMDTFAKQHK